MTKTAKAFLAFWALYVVALSVVLLLVSDDPLWPGIPIVAAIMAFITVN